MDFILGSELEVALKGTRFRSSRDVQNKMREAGFIFTDPYAPGQDLYKNWNLHGDGSIHAPLGYFPLEIVSPCLPAAEYFNQVVKLLRFLGNDVLTNTSTGFHHGLSLADPNDNAKLKARHTLMMIEWAYEHEDTEGAAWNRSDIGYAASIKRNLMEPNVRRPYMDMWRTWHEAGTHMGKYYSINFFRLSSRNPYIEIRVMGGVDYHKRMDAVVVTLSKVMSCVDHTLNDATARVMFDNMCSKFSITHSDHKDFLARQMLI